MGSPIRDNIQTKLTPNLSEQLKTAVVNLARNYPFETKRKKLQKLNIDRQVQKSLFNGGNSQYITATQANKLLGLIKITPARLHSKILGDKIYRASWELIKNNSNKIRKKIFRKLKKCFNTSRVNFQQPAENKQACKLFDELPGFKKITEEIIMYQLLEDNYSSPLPRPEGFHQVEADQIEEDKLEELIGSYRSGHLFKFPDYPAKKINEIYRHWLKNIRSRENSYQVGLEKDNALAGYCLLTEVNSSFINVNCGTLAYMQVHPDYQNSGMGSWLLKKGRRLLSDNNTHYMELKTCRDNNPARKFYKKFNFKPIARRVHFSCPPIPDR